MIVARGETHLFKVFKRQLNSEYNFDNVPSIVFRGKPAGKREKSNYRIQKGVEGNSESVYIVATNLPDNIEIGDKVEWLGKVYIVNSIGYFYEENAVINSSIMNPDYIISRCPKGINLQ